MHLQSQISANILPYNVGKEILTKPATPLRSPRPSPAELPTIPVLRELVLHRLDVVPPAAAVAVDHGAADEGCALCRGKIKLVGVVVGCGHERGVGVA